MSLDKAKEVVQELTISELIDLSQFIDEVILVKKEDAINEALLPLQALADKLSIPLQELLDKQKNKPKRQARTPKSEQVVTHRSKTNPNDTWAGRGNHPKWLREEIAKGASVDDFKV